MPAPIVVGLVQVGEVVWERRPSHRYHLVEGALRQKPLPPGQTAASIAYLPQSAALLQAYAERYSPEGLALSFLPIVYAAEPVEAVADRLAVADVVGFSCYVWNIRYSLLLAAALKARRPELVVVLGGPQVPDHPETFLKTHLCVDLVCHGEGEETFLDVLSRVRLKQWHGIASTSFLGPDGVLVSHPRRPRIKTLDRIPSPMLAGTYARVMAEAPGRQWLTTWETNRGCPFACSFCDWGSATASKVSSYSLARIEAEIEWLAATGIHHLFVCDANFGILPRDVEIARRLADTYAAHRSYVAVSVQNAKNRPDRSEEIQRIFQQSRAVSFGASVSLQSVNPAVLKTIRRDNISLEAFDRLHAHYARQGLDTYSDLIIGLPGESYESFASGVCAVIAGGQLNRIAFYECSILPNAPMADPAYRAEHGLDTVPVRIVHAHEPIEPTSRRPPEFIDIVVSTAAQDRRDWVRARVFADMVEFVFFNRLLHVPLVLLGSGLGVDYRRLFDAFVAADAVNYPNIAAIRALFTAHAEALAEGAASQYIAAPDWLDLWWPSDQFALIGLAESGRIEAFYRESEALLVSVVGTATPAASLAADAVALNQAMFTLPFALIDEELATDHPVLEAYRAILSGERPDMTPRPSVYRVRRSTTIWMSWKDWCEDLVRRAFRRRDYLWPVEAVGSSTHPRAGAPARTFEPAAAAP